MSSISLQVIQDGSRITILKAYIVGTGTDNLTDSVLFDASAYVNPTTSNKLMWMDYTTHGFSFVLSWDATTDVPFYTATADYQTLDEFIRFGGIVNNSGTGKTGDILITTSGLAAGDSGQIIFEVQKKRLTT